MYVKYPSDLIKSVEAFGLDAKEAKIYLAGLELGSASVLELSRSTRLARTTLYPILEKLRSQGVFRLTKEKKRSHYVAVPTSALMQLFYDREALLEDAPKPWRRRAPFQNFYEKPARSACG